jgi:2-(1,2-epoxy-1,2-dihydrophenyl)acetyl-CoA isomerase
MQTLLTLRRDGVFEIAFNRPQILNAANRELIADLAQATAEAADDPDARAVLLRGEGTHFMAGGDIRMFGELVELPSEARRQTFHELVDGLHPTLVQLRRMPKPVVAAVHGAAAGFGLSLVLAADLAIAAEGTQFGCGYIHLGTSPDGAMTATLPRIVGLKLAAELMLLGERFDAARARELGIVNRVVPAASLLAEARALAARLAAGPSHAYARTKALLAASVEAGLEAQLDREAESFASCAASEDFVEGVRAFLDKRSPHFTGAPPSLPPAAPRRS